MQALPQSKSAPGLTGETTRAAIGTAPSAAQLVEQRLGVLQVGGVEAFGEPVVDVGEHRARLVALALLREQPREARRSAQFECFRADLPCDRDRLAKIVGCLGFITALQ